MRAASRVNPPWDELVPSNRRQGLAQKRRAVKPGPLISVSDKDWMVDSDVAGEGVGMARFLGG